MADNDPGRTISRTAQGYMVQPGGYIPRRAVAIQNLAKWKNDPRHEQRWLCKLIGGAFQTFTVMALPGQPAAEILPLTAQLWVDILVDMALAEKQDRARVEKGLRRLTCKVKEWPQPAALIELLPRREPPANVVAAERGRTDDEHQAGLSALAEMKRTLKRGNKT